MDMNKLFKNGNGFLKYTELEKGHELEFYVIGGCKGIWSYFKDFDSEMELSDNYYDLYNELQKKKACNICEIFKASYDRLYENSCGFYRLKWDDINIKNINHAKLLLRVANKYQKDLKVEYNIQYIKTRLYYFIENIHYTHEFED